MTKPLGKRYHSAAESKKSGYLAARFRAIRRLQRLQQTRAALAVAAAPTKQTKEIA